MRRLVFVAVALAVVCANADARTISVVAFASEYGVVLLDSLKSKAAFRLFESLNVEVENRVIAETKIFAPPDGSFRIACTGQGPIMHAPSSSMPGVTPTSISTATGWS
ncbi:MAG: hypothetical protein M5U16_09165 [Hyphomicrobium sp.]|nr:hypothetical protein [Hyphomicrobium sp.]